MVQGKALIEYAGEDDLDGFMKLFVMACGNDKALQNMMFWHV